MLIVPNFTDCISVIIAYHVLVHIDYGLMLYSLGIQMFCRCFLQNVLKQTCNKM